MKQRMRLVVDVDDIKIYQVTCFLIELRVGILDKWARWTDRDALILLILLAATSQICEGSRRRTLKVSLDALITRCTFSGTLIASSLAKSAL